MLLAPSPLTLTPPGAAAAAPKHGGGSSGAELVDGVFAVFANVAAGDGPLRVYASNQRDSLVKAIQLEAKKKLGTNVVGK